MQDYIITPLELKACLTNNAEIQLIDVRSNPEHVQFNIGGILIPLNELPTRLTELDVNKTIIAYCHSGVRSLMAVKILMDAGFKHVKSLEGGIVAWQQQLS